MPIVLNETPSQQVSAGTHIAACYRIVDIGTQPDTGYGERKKIVIFWELPGETVTVDGQQKPMGVSKIYTRSLHKKASLRQDLAAWRGRDFNKEELAGFELKNILGKGCQVTVEHNDEGKAKVSHVVGLPKGVAAPVVTNALVEYSVEDGKNEVYKALPEWVRKMCDVCLDWNPQNATSRPTPADPADGFVPDDTDMPF